MRVDAASREITCKVVYYGPGMSGKTTNLKQVHDRAPARSVGDLVTLDTHSERTLHFDLLPMDLGQVNGHHVRFEFYTVPGQSYYASTRKLVLDGADAVVFVVDSRREALDENIDSMNDLLDNLRHLGLGEDLPVVIQYNKQDLPSALKPESLDPLLNSRRWPAHNAVATTGVGVIETMKAVVGLVMERVKADTAGINPGSGAASIAPPPPAPAPAATNRTQTWLISCYRCQNMLEVTGAKVGELFTCGACRSTLEIADLDRGLTRAPSSAPAQASIPLPPPSPPPPPPPARSSQQLPRPGEDSGGYGLQPVSANAGGALGVGGANASHADGLGNGAFDLEGFEQVALLDENVQARRMRVRNRSEGTRFRALVLNAVMMRQPGYAAQIENYVRLAAQIRHQHILPIHSLHQGREAPILLSQDPPDHESLAHVLARRRVLAPPHAVAVVKQIALACEEASRRGVVHGWLRPEVVLLNADSQVLVDEFGVLKHHRYLLRELSGASAGTEYYLAPEHLADDVHSDARSDMFQLGALLFRMLTGEGLVTGYTAHEALHKCTATGCRSVRSVLPQASRDLDAFVSQLTSIERKDRPQSWAEVIDVCDRFGGGAKRQTFRVTQPIESPVGHGGISRGFDIRPAQGNTGTVRRTAPSGHTGTIRRNGPGGGTGPIRRDPQSGVRHPSGARPRNDGSNGILILVVVLVLLVCAAAVIYAFNRTTPSAPHQAPNPTTSVKPAPPTVPTTVVATPAKPAQLPGFMGGGPATGGGATTKPEVEKPVAVVQPGDPAYADLIQQIADAERSQLYRDALNLCERLPLEARQTRSADIHASHLTKRDEVATQVKRSDSLDQARALLQAGLKKWNMPGDAEWAQTTMQLAGSEAVQGKPEAAPEPAPPVIPAPADPTLKPSAKATAEAAWNIEQALAKQQIPQAEQLVADLPAGSPETAAMQRRLDLWRARVEILGAGLTARKPVVRITSPTDGQQWDVAGVIATGLNVTSPTGSSTSWDWAQVPIKDLAQVAMAVADSATPPNPSESALAVIMLSAANEMALATVAFKKAKAVLPADVASDLELGLALHRQYENVDVLRRADDAAKAGNAKVLDDLLSQLRKPERAKDPEVAANLPRLEEALKRVQEGKSAENAGPSRDTLTFDDPTDLASLPLREGEWAIQGGQLVGSGTNGSVGRKDVATAKSLTVIFQNTASRGAIAINFRGVRVLMDLAKGTVTGSTRDQELKPTDFQFIPRTAHTLYIELRGRDGALVELNNGVVSMDLKLGKPADQVTLAFDTGAAIAFDEINLTRELKLDSAADAQRTAAIRNLGFEPIGSAMLVPPAIVLPNSSPRSGIGFARRAGIGSLTFEAKGKGKLEVRFGKLGEGGGQVVTLDLGRDAEQTVKYTVSWTGGVVQVRKGDPTDDVIVEDRLQGDPPHVMIVAQQEATFVSTPRLNRQ